MSSGRAGRLDVPGPHDDCNARLNRFRDYVCSNTCRTDGTPTTTEPGPRDGSKVACLYTGSLGVAEPRGGATVPRPVIGPKARAFRPPPAYSFLPRSTIFNSNKRDPPVYYGIPARQTVNVRFFFSFFFSLGLVCKYCINNIIIILYTPPPPPHPPPRALKLKYCARQFKPSVSRSE